MMSDCMYHPDHEKYEVLTGSLRTARGFNSLLGVIEGIAIDGIANETEKAYLLLWMEEHQALCEHDAFGELKDLVLAILDGCVFSDEMRQNIQRLCEFMSMTSEDGKTKSDMQRLHSIVAGIAVDDVISERELLGLSVWLEEHAHLKGNWPYDDIRVMVEASLLEKQVDAAWMEEMKEFFLQFADIEGGRPACGKRVSENATILDVCDSEHMIVFTGSKFCFTGASSLYTREQFMEMVSDRGGEPQKALTQKTQYLVIGGEGNPHWAYTRYGRKVEKAVKMQKAGFPLILIHEDDFLKAVENSL
ncbi:MAG TPA: BRCT domain-containing protein [Candidatus Sumerlaeota bacterium]|nr:BRCT domain-containing protein [Candidatus Sumerlaeota bacterium]